MGLLDEVIVISDDDSPGPSRKSKRQKAGSTPCKPSVVIDISHHKNVVNIVDDDSDIEIFEAKEAGPPPLREDKGKGRLVPLRQLALQASHAAMLAYTQETHRSTVEACQQLGTLVANLPLNLPEQLQSMQMAGATGQGAVSRRDLMKLCGHASTKQVERMIYKAASRAVQVQLNVDGSIKKDPGPELTGPDLHSGSIAEVGMGMQMSPHSRSLRGDRHAKARRQAGPQAAVSMIDSGSSSRAAVRGKRKAQHQDTSAIPAKQAQHVLKRKERVQSCPLCSAAQTVACDKLGGLPFPQLKLIMGARGLSPGRSHQACIDGMTAACQGFSHTCLLCHASICKQTGDVKALARGGEAGSSEAGSHDPALLAYKDCRWQNTAVQQCLQLCSSVDLVYKLLIQDIQPVLEETLSAGATAPDLGGQGRGGGRGGRGRGRGSPVGGRGAAYNALLDMQWGPTTFPMSMQADGWGSAPSGLHGGSANAGWAKGTGYGGIAQHPFHVPGGRVGVPDLAEKQGREAAAARQQCADEHIQRSITIICNCVEMATGQQAGGLVPSCPPIGVTAVLHGGPFAASLRLLLQNDSIMEIGAHARTYGELLRLLGVLGSSIDLAPLLYQPAEYEAEEAFASEGGPSQATQGPSVLDALHSLSQQCHVFKKSAEHLASGSAEDIGALSLALQIIDADQELQQSMAQLKKLAASDVAHSQTVPGAQTPAKGALEGPSPATEKRKRGKQAAAAAASAKAAEMQAKYVEALQPLTFREHDLMRPEARFYFRSQALASQSGGGEVMRKWLRRVSGEHASLSASLPVSWTSSIFLAADPARLDVLRAMIIGPSDTPYANGCFLFDIFLPGSYPNSPPQVQFLTTGGGRVRFNPNLYENGKVCLSLLGTWSGPSWDAAHSTLLQVLISIQSMILVTDPYYNEPGYEGSRGTPQGNQQCDHYNRQQQYNTVTHSILATLRHPDPCFQDIIRTHYKLKQAEVELQLQEWLVVADRNFALRMKDPVKAIQAELAKLA